MKHGLKSSATELASTLFSEGQGIRYDLKISFSQGQLPLLLGTFSTRSSQGDEEERHCVLQYIRR